MPTPNEPLATLTGIDNELSRPSRLHLVCPPDEAVAFRSAAAVPARPRSAWRLLDAASAAPPMSTPSMTRAQLSQARVADDEAAKLQGEVENGPRPEPSPTLEGEHADDRPEGGSPNGLPVSTSSPDIPSLSYEFSSKRLLPSLPCSFLRNGSKFSGKQTSDRSTYEVHVQLKHVDFAGSFLCGYLSIQGLTEDHPTLTTYFEGEMIGDKYTFQTRRPEWGSSEKIDFQHWALFPAYRPLATKAKRADFKYTNFAQQEHIFMRWKESFLVPDHKVKQITGASFEGFYYICFNQISGNVSGIYFHAKSEKYQKLELKHIQDNCFGAIEFR